MLNRYLILLAFSMWILSCKDSKKTEDPQQIVHTDTAETILPVFPVTDYLLGQIDETEKMEVTPLETIMANGKTDSVWIKREDVRKEAYPFLHPEIDSASLHQYYTGNSFLDRTTGSYTFTYSPKQGLPKDFDLTKIDVYVDTTNNKVQRIYLVKENGDTTRQLTWKAGKWFSIRTIVGGQVKEVKVKWDFNE